MANTVNTPVYEELKDAQDFRLLQVSNDSVTKALSIRLRTISLDDKLEYRAVSYVWGPQEPSIPVSCASTVFKVGPNLASLLQQLVSEGCQEWMFIDRLCISQEDVAERNQQVALMGRIYSTAKLVTVWLGESNSTYKLAFETFENMRDELKRRIDQDEKSKIKFGSGDGERFVWPIHYSDPGAAAIRQLLKADWFSRVWTFQELVLARFVRLKCGEDELPWYVLKLVVNCYRVVYKPGPNHDDEFLAGAERHAHEMNIVRYFLQEPKGIDRSILLAKTTLPALLSGLRDYHATDPRDKVFALLNVATDITGAHGDIQPDYSQPLLEVYASTVKWIISTYKNLSYLGMIETKDKPDLVSWIPDFRVRDPLNFTHQPELVFPGRKERWWDASGASDAMPFDNVSTPLLKLPVRTTRIGTIIRRTYPANNYQGKNILGSRALDGGEWQLFAEDAAAANNAIYHPTGEPIDLAFQRLRIWDTRPIDGNQRRFRTKALTQSDLPKLRLLQYSEDVKGLLVGPADGIEGRLLLCTNRKRMFRTDTGYLGIASQWAQVGDEVHVLMGYHLPCILRKQGGRFYSFVAESYFHGAMDGEILLREAGRVPRGDPINGLSEDDREWLEQLADWDMGVVLPNSESIVLV